VSNTGIDRVFERHLSALLNSGQPEILQGGRKGVEKESLRVRPDGRLAPTPHPHSLGSALTNEHITTDYSEALIELGAAAIPARPAPVRLPPPGR
jgi:glutamate--cysteine ligase